MAETVSTFTTVMENAAGAFEALGALVLVLGVFWSVVSAVIAWRRRGNGREAYAVLRQAFGGTLLLSLETEIEGVPPWRRASLSGAGTLGRTAQTAFGASRSSGADDAAPAAEGESETSQPDQQE
jgi:hypothetical protein